MKQTMQRTLAFLLAFVMLVGMMPISAIAAEPETEPHTHSTYPEIELDVETTVNITTGGDIAYFSFTPAETAYYIFTSISDYDTYGHLYTADMEQLAYNDQGGENSNFRIRQRLQAGTTYIWAARFYLNDEIGSFPVVLTKECIHSYSRVDFASTCTTKGYSTFTCDLCGYSYDTYRSEAVGHSFVDAVCTVCGYEVPEIQLNTDVTALIDDDYGFAYFRFTPEVSGAYTFYSIGDNDTDGYIYDSSLNRLARDYSSGLGENFSVTFQMEAGTTYILGTCFDMYECGSFIVRFVEACDHVYTPVVTAPTCTEEGYTIYTCDLCGHSYDDDYTEALSHRYASGACTRCGYTLPVMKLDTDMVAKPYDCYEGTALFSFTPTVSCNYTFYSIGDAIPFGFIYDEDMNELAYDHDGEDRNFHITYYMEANTTYLLCARNFPLVYRPFTVRITSACEHEYTAVVTDPTCLEKGYTTYTCALCTDSYVSDYTDPTGHAFASGICQNCGGDISIYPTIELNVETTATIVNKRDVAYFSFTPTEDGEYSFYSMGISDTYGYVYNDSMEELSSNDDGDSDYNFCVTYYMNAGVTYILGARYFDTNTGSFTVRITRKCNHSMSEIVTAPTCTEYGYTTYICDLCGYHYEDNYTRPGHRIDGSTCIRCGMILDELELDVETTATIANAGETVLFLFTPTVTAEYKFFSNTYYDTYGYLYDIEMNELAYDDDNGKEANFHIAYTLEAGTTYILGVRFCDPDFTGQFPIRLTMGCLHSFVTEVTEPTCIKQGYTTYTCTLCAFTYDGSYTDRISHNYVDGICTGCGHKVIVYTPIEAGIEAVANIESNGDLAYFSFTPTESGNYFYQSLGYSDTYGYIYGANMNLLAWNDDDPNDDCGNFGISYYMEAGTTYILVAHFYFNDDIGSFTVKITRECDHEYTAVVTEPTCTISGYTTYICDLCGNEYDSDYVDALGHDMDDDTCLRCGMQITLIHLNQETTATIAAGGTLAYFQFTPAETGNYVFYSISNKDTYGYIYDDSMNVLAYNDDMGGGDYNFAVSYTMEAGTTYILGAKFWNTSQTGSFTVVVSDDVPCIHEFDYVEYEPTCTTSGYYVQTCTLCGYSRQNITEYSLDHEIADGACVRCGMEVPAIELDTFMTVDIAEYNISGFFAFTPTETGMYTLQSTGYDHTVGMIYDQDMNCLAYEESDDSYVFNASAFLTAGETYILRAKYYYYHLGQFQVKISRSCDHKYSMVYTPPTCSERGTIVWVCDLCGDSYLESYIPTNSHTLHDSVCIECGLDISGFPTIQQSTLTPVTITEENEMVYYYFIPSETGIYKFYSTGEYDTYGVLFNDDMWPLCSTDMYGKHDNFAIYRELVAGETYILAAQLNKKQGCAEFEICVDPVDSIELQLDTTVDLEIAHEQEEYVFSFTPEKSGRYVLHLPTNCDPYYFVFGLESEWVYYNSYTVSDNEQVIIMELNGGETYVVDMRLYYLTEESYCSVRLEAIPEPEVIPLALNKEHEVNISKHGQYATFSFTPAVTSVYRFSFRTEHEIFLNLFGSYMDDNFATYCIGTDEYSYIDYELQAGHTYYLSAEYNYLGNIGSFNICVQKLGDSGEPEVPSEPVDTLEIITQPADYVGVIGDMATFTVETDREDVTYQWYFSSDNGATWQKSSCTVQTLTVEFKAYRLGYLYRCEVTDSDGNTVISDAAVLAALELDIEILTQPENYVGAVNDEVTFAVEATGNGLTYKWFYSSNGETWVETFSPGYATNTVKPIMRAYRDGYMFKCVITDILGNSVESDVVSMTVETSEIIIVTQPVSVENAVLGQLYGFSVVAEGANLTYRWELSTDGGETWQDSWNGGYNTPDLDVRMNANRDGNMYRCAITSGQKLTVYTDAVILDMQDPSVNLVNQSGNVFVTANKTATFTVDAEGMDLTYAWYRSNDKGVTWNPTYLSGYNTNTLSFVGTVGRAAMYMCKITDGSGTVVWSSPVKLQILSAELKILTQPVSTTCADGETVSFTVEAQGDTLKYQWYSSSDGVSWTASYLTGYDTPNFSFTVNSSRAAKLYKCVITDVAGNTVATNAVSVTIG